MKKIITAAPINNNHGNMKFDVLLPSKCPICEVAFAEAPKASYFTSSKHHSTVLNQLYSVYFCPHCEEMFLVICAISGTIFDQPNHAYTIKTYPEPGTTTEFSEYITKLSSRFVEVYHQAECAENSGLFEICGMGYRKAVEVLIKDYAIWKYPDEIEKIKRMLLAQCIEKYIVDNNIKTLASGCAWIGNDESHYEKKHLERDVNDLKLFIHALVQFINLMIAVEDAASLLSKKKENVSE